MINSLLKLGLTEPQIVEILNRQFGMSATRAQFAIDVELGRIPGDVRRAA